MTTLISPPAVSTKRVVEDLSRKFVSFLETLIVPDGLFATEAFIDLSLPQWRLQATGVEGMVELRTRGHNFTGDVAHWRSEATESGFVIEFDESWANEGQQWYCREMAWAKVEDGLISEMSIYCTGDWDEAAQAEHGRSVTLLRA